MRAGLAVTLAILLCGCESPPEKESGNDLVGGPEIVTDPTTPPDGQAHVHDYWRGLTRVEVINSTLSLGPTNTEAGVGTLQIDPPTTVFPGTAWVNVSVHLSPDTGPQGDIELSLRYQDAASSELHDLGRLRDGDVAVINTTEVENDPPHAQVSRWAFYLGLGGLSSTEANVVVTIARPGGPLPVSPPHPDFWGDNTTRLLFDVKGPLLDAVPVGELQQAPPNNFDSDLVVPSTGSVRVQFFFNSSTPSQLGYHPLLNWKSAASRDYVTETPTVSPGLFEWNFGVEPEMWDSPYVNQTSWEFSIDLRGNPPLPAVMSGDYHIVGNAFKK